MASSLSAAVIQTRITSLLKCRHPIVLPGMSWISTPELVAAVSNAGGLGILATGPLTSHETKEAIQRIRSLTNKPFGIGATLLMPGATENAQIALEEQVPVINVSLGKAHWIKEGLGAYGGKMISTVTNTKHAAQAIDAGADALLVTGHEAAAHGGDVTSLVLINSISQQFPKTPIIAAGGFTNGRSLVAALSLGADAVAMGTRFAMTADSPLPDAIKQTILESSENDTIYGKNFDGIPARILKTPLAAKAMASRPNLLVVMSRALRAAHTFNVPLWKVLPGLVLEWDKMYAAAQFGAATQTLMKASIEGNLQEGIQFVGQGQGLIQDDTIPSVEELIEQIMTEAKDVSIQTANRFANDTVMEEEEKVS